MNQRTLGRRAAKRHKDAINDVMEGVLSYQKVETAYHVPRSTLCNVVEGMKNTSSPLFLFKGNRHSYQQVLVDEKLRINVKYTSNLRYCRSGTCRRRWC